MNISKSFLIGIGSYLAALLIFWQQSNQGFIESDFISDQKWILLMISFLRILLAFIWENPDQNTKKLKKGSLILMLYAFCLLFIKPVLNLNHREFGISYFCSIQLYLSIGNIPGLKKQIKIGFLSLILLFFASIHFLMVYRNPTPIEEFLANEPYQMSFFEKEKTAYPEILIISQKNSTQKLTLPLEKPHLLQKNRTYHLSYQSPNPTKNSLIISSPQGTLLELFPQSAITLETNPEKISFQLKKGKISQHHYGEKNQKSDFSNFFHNYHKRQEKFIQNTLPERWQHSPNFQALSFKYTLFLGTFLPFYQENKAYALTYQKYQNISSEKKQKIWSFGRETLFQNNQLELGKTKSSLEARLGKKGRFSTFF